LCIYFEHIPEELKKKPHNRSKKCIFTKYSEKSKSYIIYNPDTKKFLVSKDVEFLENRSSSDQENETLDNQNKMQQIYEQTKILEQQAHPQRL
jgi:hypothetical protein